MDNAETQVLDNPVTQTTTETAPVAKAPVVDGAFSWKSNLMPDYANSPTIQLFPDTKEGFNDAMKSHLGLVKLLGHDKVPIPKGKDDVVAREIFNKALGVPDKPDGYALPDIDIPESMKGLTFDKKAFSEVLHKHHLPPESAKGLWETYTQLSKQTYEKAVKAHQDKMTSVVNEMKAEWGDAYQAKVELGQVVINKFSGNQEINDYVTSTLSKDPRGIKFLAQIGEQFTENKIGEFKSQRFSLTPEEAQAEWDAIRSNPSHPYMDEKAPQAAREAAIKRVNELINVVRKKTG